MFLPLKHKHATTKLSDAKKEQNTTAMVSVFRSLWLSQLMTILLAESSEGLLHRNSQQLTVFDEPDEVDKIDEFDEAGQSSKRALSHDRNSARHHEAVHLIRGAIDGPTKRIVGGDAVRY